MTNKMSSSEHNQAPIPTRPILRYHGGKFLLADWIISFFPKHRVYVEPFGGAASVLLRKPRAYSEVYNDIDGELVNLFRVLRNPSQGRELRRLLEYTPYARAEFESAYFTATDSIESARRLIIRSFMGIGNNRATALSRRSIGRPSTGFRAVLEPNGGLRAEGWASYVDGLDAFIKRLRPVVVENKPAIECIEQFDSPNTLFYCDPPYVKTTRRDINDDYSYEMTDDEHKQLADCLHSVKGMVVLSGYHSDLYDNLYSDWLQVSREAYADQAQKRIEVLWLNDVAAHQQPQQKLFDQ